MPYIRGSENDYNTLIFPPSAYDCHLQKSCHKNFTNSWCQLCELCSFRHDRFVQCSVCTTVLGTGPRGRIQIIRWDADIGRGAVMEEKTIYNWPEVRGGAPG